MDLNKRLKDIKNNGIMNYISKDKIKATSERDVLNFAFDKELFLNVCKKAVRKRKG